MKKIFLSNVIGGKYGFADSKIHADFLNILKNDFYCYKIFYGTELFHKLRALLKGCLYAISKNDTFFCFAYPIPFSKKYPILQELFFKCLKLRHNKLCCIIIDLESVRKMGISFDLEKKILKQMDMLIVHNDCMKRYVKKYFDVEHLIEMEMFDYLDDRKKIRIRKMTKQVVFAGNLKKSTWLKKIIKQEKLGYDFRLYGSGLECSEIVNRDITYLGAYPPNQIIQVLDGSFGLIWDGDSIDQCSGVLGDYMKINHPHKCSQYIAAGLPIIVWEKAAVADLVRKYKIGFTISSLEEIAEKINLISEEEYIFFYKNILELREKVMKGYFVKKAIEKAYRSIA